MNTSIFNGFVDELQKIAAEKVEAADAEQGRKALDDVKAINKKRRKRGALLGAGGLALGALVGMGPGGEHLTTALDSLAGSGTLHQGVFGNSALASATPVVAGGAIGAGVGARMGANEAHKRAPKHKRDLAAAYAKHLKKNTAATKANLAAGAANTKFTAAAARSRQSH